MSKRHLQAAAFGLTLVPVGADHSLADSLLRLGIRVYAEDSVDRYKEKVLATIRRPKLETLGSAGIIGSVILVIVGVIVAICALAVGAATGSKTSLITGVASLLACVVGIISFIGIVVLLQRANPNRAAHWRRTPFKKYRRSVPPEIRARADRITAALPTAELAVDWIDEDPFLVVMLDGQTAYVGVWDEHGFA